MKDRIFSSARRGLVKLAVFFVFLILFFAAAPGSAHAAEFYWYGGSGNWSDYTNHWSNNSGNSPASPAANAPTSADNVHFDANSFTGAGQIVTVDATAYCKDMDWTGATNTPTLAGSSIVNVYSNVTFIAAMTFSYTTYITFADGGANLRSLTTNGLNLASGSIKMDDTGATLTLQDNLTIRYFNLNSGTINTNTKTVTCYIAYLDNTNVRVLNISGSTINCSSNLSSWHIANATNLTITVDSSSVINLTGNGSTFVGGGLTYNNVNLNGTSHTISGNNTFANLTRNGTATKTDTLTLTSGTTITATTFAMKGNSSTNRLLVQSSTLGSPATITATNWTGSQNVDLMDITATNAVDLSAITGLSGDAGGNTNITFTTAAPQTWTPTSGTAWSTAANWTSRVPLPQDDVSAGGTGNTITVDMPRIGKSITFTGTPILSASIDVNVFGSVTVASGMTWFSTYTQFYGRGDYVLSPANKAVQWRLYAYGGSLTYASADSTSHSMRVYAGTFNTGGYDITFNDMYSSGSLTRAINLGSSTITVNSASAISKINFSGSNFTFNAGTSTIILTNSTANAQTFAGGGLTYNNVTVQGAGNYALTISGNNTFNIFTVDRSAAAKTIKFTDGSTQTVSNFVSAVSGTTVLTLNGTSTAGWNITKPGGGTIGLDYANISYSAANPASTWYYGANSTADSYSQTNGWTADTTAPAGGSITYTDGYYTAASVSLTVDDGTDSGVGIDTSSRIIQRKSATLTNGSCGSYGSFATISPTGTYPSFTDTTVTTGNCYQYKYLVSDFAGNQASLTLANTVKVDTGNPSAPGTPSTTNPTNSTSQTWSWTAATDAVSGIASYAWRVVDSADNPIVNGATGALSVITNLGEGVWNFFVKAIDNATNQSSESSSSVTVDTATPVTTDNVDSSSWRTSSVTVTLSCSNSGGSTCAHTYYTTDGSTPTTGSSSGSGATTSFTLSSDGTYTIKYFSVNTAGTTESVKTAANQVKIDQALPINFDLNSPSNNSYTSSERPAFRWNVPVSADATSSLSKYVLIVDNSSLGSGQPSGDFAIDNIPTSGTSDVSANKYTVHFDGFDDSDLTNNYISIWTKSSSDWGSNDNDGKLREGKVSWKIGAFDNAGNERANSRTLFVDRTSPNLELSQINSTPYNSNSFTTTDTTPTVYGKITDSLSGGEDSKVSSGPKNIEVKIEKKDSFGLYNLLSLTTVNLNDIYWTSDGTRITDNSENKSGKYSTFSFTPQETLSLGDYKIVLTGKDNADNSGGAKTLYLNISTFAQIATPEEQQANPPSSDGSDQTTKEIQITKPTQSPQPGAFNKAAEGLANAGRDILQITGNLISLVFVNIGHGIGTTLNTANNGLGFVFEKQNELSVFALNKTGQGLSCLGQGIGTGFNSAISFIGQNYTNLVNNTSGATKNILLAVGNATKTLGNGLGITGRLTGTAIYNIDKGITDTKKAIKNQLADISFALGKNIQNTSNKLGMAIIKIGYIFTTEPTRISDVRVAKSTPTSATITWKTNHPANGKVNYGFKDGEYLFEEQSDKRTTDHEFVLNNLKPNTQYNFEVMSQNRNYVYDANRKFNTPAK